MEDLQPDSWKSSPGLDALAIEWLDWLLNVRGRSTNTIQTYGVYLRLWFNWCREHGVKPLSPTLEELEAFLRRPRLRQGHGDMGAPSTQRGNVTVLKGWFGWMHKRGYVPTDPTVDLFGPKLNKTLPKPVPDKHWTILWQSQLQERLRLGLGLGYFCGLRRQEMCELRGKQITPTHIRPFVRKGGGEDALPWRGMVDVFVQERPELIEPHADTFISLMSNSPRTYGREGRVLWRDGQTFYKLMVKVCDELRIPRYTPHQLRHSCATNLVKLGMRETMVAELLNHSSVDITRKYAAFNGEDLDAWRRGLRRRDPE